jgi:hypothetical protein
MPALARSTTLDCYSRAANDDCINGGSRTRTKYGYNNPLSNVDPSGFGPCNKPTKDYVGGDLFVNFTSITSSLESNNGEGGNNFNLSDPHQFGDFNNLYDFNHGSKNPFSGLQVFNYDLSQLNSKGPGCNGAQQTRTPIPLPPPIPRITGPHLLSGTWQMANLTPCKNYWQIVGGFGGVLLGGAAVFGGAAEALLGLGGSESGVSWGLVGQGFSNETLGVIAVRDGINLMQSGIDGVQRQSTLGAAGQYLGGGRGQDVGDLLNLGLSVKGLADIAYLRNKHGAYFVNVIASTIFPEYMHPCQTEY